MWWPAVFWILLIPLIVVEFIVFIKTRKVSWLIYALAIFTYVIAVTYTIDVFDMGRNAVILTLLASAALMWYIGRQLQNPIKESKTKRNIIIAIGAVMLVLIIISVAFGRAQEQVTPVPSISADSVIVPRDARGEPKPLPGNGATLLRRTVTNNFILPVPVDQNDYRACLSTTQGLQDLYYVSEYQENLEVNPGQTKTFSISFGAAYLDPSVKPIEVFVYEFDNDGEYSYVSCQTLSDREAQYRIPVQ